MNARTIIDELGGYRTVATALEISPMRVHNWTRRGIASEFWPDVIKLAASREKNEITFDVLKATRRALRAAV